MATSQNLTTCVPAASSCARMMDADAYAACAGARGGAGASTCYVLGHSADEQRQRAAGQAVGSKVTSFRMFSLACDCNTTGCMACPTFATALARDSEICEGLLRYY